MDMIKKPTLNNISLVSSMTRTYLVSLCLIYAIVGVTLTGSFEIVVLKTSK